VVQTFLRTIEPDGASFLQITPVVDSGSVAAAVPPEAVGLGGSDAQANNNPISNTKYPCFIFFQVGISDRLLPVRILEYFRSRV
jgi:hypothetical protein